MPAAAGEVAAVGAEHDRAVAAGAAAVHLFYVLRGRPVTPLFPYTTLFRSRNRVLGNAVDVRNRDRQIVGAVDGDGQAGRAGVAVLVGQGVVEEIGRGHV